MHLLLLFASPPHLGSSGGWVRIYVCIGILVHTKHASAICLTVLSMVLTASFPYSLVWNEAHVVVDVPMRFSATVRHREKRMRKRIVSRWRR